MTGIACVFAGQGGQFVGMGRDLYENFSECKAVFDLADSVLGQPVSKVCFEGPEDVLTRSDFCQPAIFTVSVACYKALVNCLGKVPQIAAMAGLSLGEWTALHLAGVVNFEDTVKILAARGRFMQEACEDNPGAMVSIIGLSEDKLAEICSLTGVWIANVNSNEQIVLSGKKEAILESERLAKEAGAKKTVILKVAGAYHSPLMGSAVEKLNVVLDSIRFSNPSVTVLSNVTGVPHADPSSIRSMMLKQIVSSVKWLDCVNWMKSQSVSGYLELGPGRVLSGLIKRIDTSAEVINIQDMASLQKACEVIKQKERLV